MARKTRPRRKRLAHEIAADSGRGRVKPARQVAVTRPGSVPAASAAKVYQRLLARDPGNAEALFQLGLIEQRAGRQAAARELIDRAIRADPERAAYLGALGTCARALGEPAAAAAAFRRALELEPKKAGGHNNLGVVLLDQGELEAAIAAFGRAIALEPDYAEAHNNLGIAARGQGKLGPAASAFRRALEIRPRYAEAHNNLGNVLLEQGQATAAVGAFHKALRLKPAYPEAHNNLGNALKSQGKFAEAASAFRRALKLNPGYAEAHNNLGIVLCARGEVGSGVAAYRRAIAAKPDYVAAHYNLALVHQHLRGDPAIAALEKLLARPERSPGQRIMLLFALGKAYDDIGRYARAFAYFRRANKEKATETRFDAARHRREMTRVKRAFRARRDAVAERPSVAARIPVFVIGPSRSGKTLVESLLSQHAQVHAAGERPEWAEALTTVLDKHAIARPFPGCMRDLSPAQIAEIGESYLEALSERAPDRRFVVNTMPANYPYVGLILEALPAARIISCERDPLDNCLYIYFQRYAAHHDYAYDLGILASFYADYRGMMRHWRALFGERILSVKYEELVADPALAGARIYRYCGLGEPPATLRQTFSSDEIGHWKRYARYLGPLRRAFGDAADSAPQPIGEGR